MIDRRYSLEKEKKNIHVTKYGSLQDICNNNGWATNHTKNWKKFKISSEKKLIRALRGPSRKIGSNCCTFSYFFYWRKFILKVWLITYQKDMSLRATEPPQERGYVCIVGFHKFTSSKLWGRFSQLFVFPKLG